MTAADYVTGDVYEVMATIPDGSVDLILTSPPFLALRSYLPADHPDKAKELGSEATPAAFIDTLLALTAEWRRILAPHGSICVELGDTYSGSGGAGGDYGPDGLRAGQAKFRQGTPRWDGRPEGQVRTTTSDPVTYPPRSRDGWPLAKSLCMIPESYRWALAYGRNPFTGAASPAGQWRVRNNVNWCRPNPPVGALGDKVRPATSDLAIACISKDRYFDLDAIREPATTKPQRRFTAEWGKRQGLEKGVTYGDNYVSEEPVQFCHRGGAPPLDWWQISTEPYEGSHYATWPRELCRRPILAMCPQKVCRTCGEPSRRIVGDAEYVPSATNRGGAMTADVDYAAAGERQGARPDGLATASVVRQAPTLGWTDCGCDDWRTGLVLDPFGGSGTTGAVATGNGRDALLIDLDERNAELALHRIGPLMTTLWTFDEWKNREAMA